MRDKDKNCIFAFHRPPPFSAFFARYRQYPSSGRQYGSIIVSTPDTMQPTYQQSAAFSTWHSSGSTRFNSSRNRSALMRSTGTEGVPRDSSFFINVLVWLLQASSRADTRTAVCFPKVAKLTQYCPNGNTCGKRQPKFRI